MKTGTGQSSLSALHCACRLYNWYQYCVAELKGSGISQAFAVFLSNLQKFVYQSFLTLVDKTERIKKQDREYFLDKCYLLLQLTIPLKEISLNFGDFLP